MTEGPIPGSWGRSWQNAFGRGGDALRAQPAWQDGSPERRNFGEMAKMNPIFGAYTALTGNNPISGARETKGGRILAGLPLLAKVGGMAAPLLRMGAGAGEEIQAAEKAATELGPMQGPSPKIVPKQWAHIPREIPDRMPPYGPGKSILTEDPSELGRYAGTGEAANGVLPKYSPGYKERIDFGRVIGQYVNKKNNFDPIPTTRAIIHYGKNGIHIVPSEPW